MFCQVAFSDKRFSRYYTFENTHVKIRGSNKGTVILDFTHTHSRTHYYKLQEGRRCEYIHLFVLQPKIPHSLSLKTKGLPWTPLLPFPWAILNKDTRFWYSDLLPCVFTGWGRALGQADQSVHHPYQLTPFSTPTWLTNTKKRHMP